MKFYESGEYRATKDWPYAISAGCVIYRYDNDDVTVLLLTRNNKTNSWGRNGGQEISYHLPKGHCGLDEGLQQSALRESEEEAGVEAEIITYLGARSDDFVHPNTQLQTHKTIHYFAALWQKDLENKDDEHDDVVWVSLEEAGKLLGPPNPKGEEEAIERLKEFLELTK